MKKDYYEILGVAKDATPEAMKKKYRSLALKYHPDRVPEKEKKQAEERFKEISEAYGVLSDPQKRQMYDQYGHAGIDQRYTSEDIFKGADFGTIFEDLGLGDIFGSIFGDSIFSAFGGGGFSGGARRPRRGRDIQYELEISLEESYKGIKKQIKVPRNEFCEPCKGTGAKGGTALKSCPTCQGQGQVFVSSGFFRMGQTCSSCRGAGKTIVEHCPNCHGKGAKRVTHSIDVNIPAGVDNDTRLRVKGEGEVGQGGPGDLYLYLFVKENSTFKRDGRDLLMEYPLNFVKAALGGDVSIPTLSGKVSMKIPAGTQSGKVFRLKGEGMPDLHSSVKGHLYIKVMIQVPTQLSPEQRKLLQDFAKISGVDSSELGETIAEKIKKVFK